LVTLVEVLPSLHECGEVRQLHRFDLLPEGREGASASYLDHPTGAPLDILQLPPEFSANELARFFPLGEPRFDPIRFPAVAVMNFGDTDWTGLSEKARQNLAARYRWVDRGLEQNIGDQRRRLVLNQLGRSTNALQLLHPERRDVSRIDLGQNEAPFSRTFRPELYRDHPAFRQKLRKRIAAYAFRNRSNSCPNLFAA